MNERSSDDPVTPRRPRGRPRRFDAEAGVAAARELFAARGYDGVGVAELCAALGITPTSLYAAWGSKAGLHAACVAGYAAETAAAFAAALARAASPAEVRPCLLAAAAEAYVAAGRGCMVLDGMHLASDPAVRAVLQGHAAATEAAITARLTTLGLPAGDAAFEAAVTIVLMRGLASAARAGAVPEVLRAAAAVSAGASAAPSAPAAGRAP